MSQFAPSVTKKILEVDDYYGDDNLKDCVLQREGVLAPVNDEVRCKLYFCSRCHLELQNKQFTVPTFSPANYFFTGSSTQIVKSLPLLNFLEKLVIGLVRVNGCVLKLRVAGGRAGEQLGLRGHIIMHKQDPQGIPAALVRLPLKMHELPDYIQILFVDQHKTDVDNPAGLLKPHKELLQVSREKFSMWLNYLNSFHKAYVQSKVDVDELVQSYGELNVDGIPKVLESAITVVADKNAFDTAAEEGPAVQRDDLILNTANGQYQVRHAIFTGFSFALDVCASSKRSANGSAY
jgi:hypothetical protein